MAVQALGIVTGFIGDHFIPVIIGNGFKRDVLCNTLLQDLPEEEWKLVEGFENYAISNYGRLKSLERWTFLPVCLFPTVLLRKQSDVL
ncbi:NUMOD4 domain-containing protein [Chryseobacterium defluvii]|uniref:NUMOD4 domain-containing protein n=1 Tax=Chryseobacterium defluvii TaxID=160396 RepID=UPI001610EA20